MVNASLVENWEQLAVGTSAHFDSAQCKSLSTGSWQIVKWLNG